MSHLLYWGKSSDAGYHPLPYHSLDVAAVTATLLDVRPNLLSHLSNELQLSSQVTKQLVVFFAALHDLGKFSETFQNLRPELRQQLLGNPTAGYEVYEKRHDGLGLLLWHSEFGKACLDENWVRVRTGGNERTLARYLAAWLQIAASHHGKVCEMINRDLVKAYFTQQDIAAATQFGKEVGEILDTGTDPVELPDKFKHLFARCSWLLNGLYVVADWVGSNTDLFPYYPPNLSCSEYWQQVALPQARLAIQRTGFQPPATPPALSFAELFGFNTPTPLQSWSSTVQLQQQPQVIIIEDVTGAGKTEAVQMVASRMLADGLIDGLYFALPTAATSNSMYQRIASWYQRLWPKAEQAPSLVLSHSNRDLSSAFVHSIGNDNYGQEPSASTYCNEWFAQGNKRALLADLGVGTIDQALQTVLPLKFQNLRTFGLFRQLLIVDEVHAYDDYMLQLLKRLLHFHAAQGGSVCLLSATMPQRLRRDLLQAYAAGRQNEPPTPQSDRYPLVTHYSEGSVDETPLQTRETVKRKVEIQRISSRLEACDRLAECVTVGGCALWIRNTVADAQESYFELRQDSRFANARIHLLHARFTMSDRAKQEHQALELIGKNSTPNERSGLIYITTQVAEQSLDIDADVLITDLAPIDLLIQRGGRYQRHSRTHRPISGCYLLSNDPHSVVDPNWIRGLFPRGQYVYPAHGQLWRAADILVRKGGWSMPEDARELIEHVYGPDTDKFPEALQESEQSAREQFQTMAAAGASAAMDFEIGMGRQRHWSEEGEHYTTRYGDSSLQMVLAQINDGELAPLHREANPAHSQMNLSDTAARRLSVNSPALDDACRQFRLKLPRQGEFSNLLLLTAQADRWQVVGFNPAPKVQLENSNPQGNYFYSHELGLYRES